MGAMSAIMANESLFKRGDGITPGSELRRAHRLQRRSPCPGGRVRTQPWGEHHRNSPKTATISNLTAGYPKVPIQQNRYRPPDQGAEKLRNGQQAESLRDYGQETRRNRRIESLFIGPTKRALDRAMRTRRLRLFFAKRTRAWSTSISADTGDRPD
jgi:hypothetical protein